mgnify:CR=1 FL=1
MRFTRSRAAVLGAAAVMLTLTACAPPGQDGAPGVAANYGKTVITNADVDATYQAWLNDTMGQDTANRRQVLTIELLRDDLLAAAKDQGYPVTRATAKQFADQWIIFKGQQGKASEETILATQGIIALMVVAYNDPTLNAVREISDKVAAEANISPRSGEYSTDALLTSIQAAMKSAEDQQLGQFSYTAFQNVSAFVDADRPWFDR